MKKYVWGKSGIRLMFLIVLCVGMTCFTAYGAPGKKVRVGYYTEEGYHTVAQERYHDGYDYEYLTEIAKETGWEYEYVEGTWQECISRLESGEIDLLGGVERTEDRLKTMSFPSVPSIYAGNCLLVEHDSKDYGYEDFEAFDGIRIGTLTGSTLSRKLESYSEQNHFRYEFLHYDTEGELAEALRRNEIDCVNLSDIRNLGDYKIIGRFGYTPLYYATSKKRSDLNPELDSAIRRIRSRDHYYESRLHQKYFTAPVQNAYTREEKEYIQQHKQVKVALVADFPLICEYRDSTKQYGGIIVDALERLSDKTGLDFVYTRMPEGVVPWDYLKEHPNVIMAPFLVNSLITYMDEIEILDTIVEGRMVAVTRSGETLALEQEFVLAIPEDMYGMESRIRDMFPEVRIVTCRSHQEGLEMVRKREADMTLVNEITGAYLLQSPYYKKLSIFNTESILEDITMAVGSDSDPELISILNKGIASFDGRDVRQLVVDNTAASSYVMNPREWIYEKMDVLLVILMAMLVGIVSFFFRVRRRRTEQEERERIRLAEERMKADRLYQEKMFRQASFDGLTGLYNRDYFVEKANDLMEQHPRKVYSLFWINVEKFKLINEMFGRERGDMVLLHIADKLRESIGKEGVYGKLYSDQFLICYPVDEEELRKVHIPDVEFLECRGARIRIQFKIGIYINRQHERNVGQLLEYAQIAMQNQEDASSTHVRIYKDAYLDVLLKNQRITNEMETALREGQFQIYLQPQYDHVGNLLVGAEALVRWKHPVRGMISPAEFIPVFESNRFIDKLDSYICDRVCELLAKWKKQGTLIPISVNLSKYDIQNPDLIPGLKRCLEQYDIPFRYLHLEITESAYAERQQEMISVVEELQEMGFTIEMDDFGSEYSSLNMLKDVPVDVLKLDMKFFGGETHMDKGGSIVESVVRLAHSLGMPVIAEGVETEREANFLKSIDCRIVQGYLYGRPMPVEEFEKLMADSMVGDKEITVGQEKEQGSTYWTVEKCNVLLRSGCALVMDYDPFNDYALFTMADGDRMRERAALQYAETLQTNPMIHPEDRRFIVDQILHGTDVTTELRYRADYFGTGQFRWYHAGVYRYFRQKKLSRVLAVIREEEPENS
ncbi:MAG: EAL domain-containing protein [Eubacteriales bacterium]|nr:EAL domain-containing protein [Eubacteriales bacterium]